MIQRAHAAHRPHRIAHRGAAKPGDVVSYTAIRDFERLQLEGLRREIGWLDGELPPVRNDVSLYRVIYKTTDLHGNLVDASGLLVVPLTKEAVPLLSCQHGTIAGVGSEPSSDIKGPEGLIATIGFAASGYMTAVADYLGFGEAAEPDPRHYANVANVHKPGVNQQRAFHPYLDAKTEASASTDMLRATRAVAKELGTKLTSQLFLTGYSQGGQATMALHRHLESTAALRKEFPVTASAPMAGPHNLPGSTEAIFKKPVPRTAAEIVYATIAFDNQKPLAPALDKVFNTKTAEVAWRDFSNGTHSWFDDLLGRDPKSLFTSAYLATFFKNGHLISGSDYANRLEADRTDNWATKTPIRLVHGKEDREVPYAVNGPAVVAAMKKRGCTDIGLITVSGDHETAALPCVAGAAAWLDSLRTDITASVSRRTDQTARRRTQSRRKPGRAHRDLR